MILQEARPIARRLVQSMAPFCYAVEIAGSIRREKQDVKDVEIVACPIITETADPTDLFGEKTIKTNRLFEEWATTLADNPDPVISSLQWIKPGTPHIESWHVQAGGKYWRGYLPNHEVKVDIFLPQSANWGAVYLIRTGSADFSHAVVTHALRAGFKFHEGGLWSGDLKTYYPTADERSVFSLLRLEYVEPAERTGPEAVRVIRKGGTR